MNLLQKCWCYYYYYYNSSIKLEINSGQSNTRSIPGTSSVFANCRCKYISTNSRFILICGLFVYASSKNTPSSVLYRLHDRNENSFEHKLPLTPIIYFICPFRYYNIFKFSSLLKVTLFSLNWQLLKELNCTKKFINRTHLIPF